MQMIAAAAGVRVGELLAAIPLGGEGASDAVGKVVV